MKKHIFLTLGLGTLIFFYMYMASILNRYLQDMANLTFQVYTYVTFNQLAYIPIGFILGFRCWNEQRKREGSWKLDKIRISIIGIPSLYFLLIPYMIKVEPLFPLIMITNSSLSAAIQVVFGYILVTSFYKEEQFL
ncbi:hypothetical protein [Halobacillus sp. BBL2006]|uniref:hypothetical protein n=1 Tax=Halobacillus sp. BBL2006 TaxID=1543706 RepID=UPI000543B025|nr:hypothetical protein [Halobacillus sp. BBL2006]KHE72805.1 hypothetical protein LD39_02645 [Halobacillus sp. BBL2006]